MKLGLCLTGGGAKGAFQAGVVYGLYERGFKFDVITGTSIGAINGYYIYTNNVNKLKEMWINIQSIDENGIQIINNTVDNSVAINMLSTLKDNSEIRNNFYVNYVQVENSKMKEVIVNVAKESKEQGLNSIKYSSLLPFISPTCQNPSEQFKKNLLSGMYNGYKLDGGIVNNTLLMPLIEENVDKIILISMNKNFELPHYVKKVYNEKNVIIIKPNIEFNKTDTLNFTEEFCKTIFEQGYEISKYLEF